VPYLVLQGRIRQSPQSKVLFSHLLDSGGDNRVLTSIRTLAMRTCFAMFLSLAGSGACLADSVVIVSTNNLYKHGELLTEDFVIKLGSHDFLRVLDPRTNKTLTLVGPYEGIISKYSGRCPSGPGRCNHQEPIDIGGSRGIPQ
jgi:hypothetical protein